MVTSGYIFLWTSWLLWIIVTFFMSKTRRRAYLATWILLSIIGSNSFFIVEGFHISYAYFILIGGALLMHGKCPRWTYNLFISFTIMIGYTAILLWEYTSPIWMVIPRFILIPLLCSCMIFILIKGFYNQLMTGLLGLCAGELLYSLMLSSYFINRPIGDVHFLDHLLIVISSIFLIHIIQHMRARILSWSHTNLPQKLPKEKIM